jgi:hypothetical protein
MATKSVPGFTATNSLKKKSMLRLHYEYVKNSDVDNKITLQQSFRSKKRLELLVHIRIIYLLGMVP